VAALGLRSGRSALRPILAGPHCLRSAPPAAEAPGAPPLETGRNYDDGGDRVMFSLLPADLAGE